MNAKEWFEQSGYEYKLEEYDEGGYLGIDENKVAEMLDAYHEHKLKLLEIADVSQQSELLICPECKKYATQQPKQVSDDYYKKNNISDVSGVGIQKL